MLQHTSHSALRAAQRGLSDEEIEYIYCYGTRYHRAGVVIYFLRWRDLPVEDTCWDWATRLVGTALVVSKDHSDLLTVWRNRRDGLKHIRKKENFRSSKPNNDIVENYLWH